MSTITLFELNEFIRRVLALNLPESLWIRCELAEVKTSRGHFYLELVQKGEGNEDIVARGQAVLWNGAFRVLQKKRGLELDALLREGMEVLMLAKVDYHERYGLKLIVEDFDPAYSIGKLELKRREIVRQLQQMNLLDKQKKLTFPVVLQNLAVLTSETAAGYQDFIEHLKSNYLGYQFRLSLFQTAMQGGFVESEMTSQLEKIRRKAGSFDAVMIIRGGGAKLDLASFDNLELGKAIANFPIPILTGIGHEVDETVLDLVAFASLKTPTAVADFILNHNMQFEAELLRFSQVIINLSGISARKQEIQLQQLAQTVFYQVKSKIRNQQMMLNYIEKEVPAACNRLTATENLRVETFERIINTLRPETIFKRGFSMVMKKGKALLSADELQPGDDLEVHLHKGTVLTTVKEVKNE